MRPVILLRRAGMHENPIDLVKAGRSHKYWKREPYFVGGKLRYRYYYNTPEDRARWAKEHDPEDKHEHRLASDIAKVHTKLSKNLPPTASLNAEAIEAVMQGMAPRGSSVKVHISARFERAHKQPFVDAEESGAEVERNPIQRVAKAMQMVPESIRSLVNINALKITTRKDPAVKKMFEQGDPPRPVPAAFSDREGNIVLCADGEGHGGGDGFNVHPSGWPRFGSPLTLSEESVWREVGRQLRYALTSKRKEAWAEWKELATGSGTDTRLSSFARQNADHDFMESFACALSHPKQLAMQAPQRYEFFRKHGLVDLPPLNEMLSTPDASLAWWENAPATGAKKLMHEKLAAEAPVGVAYHSPKDEFFQVSKGGRTLYFRIGPPSADAEPGWERMPDVIDPETGTPVYDTAIARRFNVKEPIKEIFDEHGNRHTLETAYLFLNQDEDIKELKSTHSLAYMMYDGLGSSRGEQDKEREAIKQMQKKGIDPSDKRADRWEKVPHRIDEAEFHAKTPSFSFGKLRAAASQPYVAFQDGKPLKHTNPMTGKEEFKLKARVYESQNPDGSIARIVIQEEASFSYGEEVYLPVTTTYTDPETGESFEKTVEELVKLDPKLHPDITAKGLSKQFKIPAQDLLARNNRLQQFQFRDPLMAQLINPSGVAIKDRATLVALMKSAADAQPEAWTTIQFGDEPPLSHVHAKVKFDGAGSPLLVGEYWQSKLGKPNPRVSDLITSGSKLRVEKPYQKKVRGRPIKPGGPVRVKVGKQWVFATLAEKEVVEGKRRYKVVPLPGQGVDVEPMEVKQVRSVPTDMDPERPNILLRDFKQPRSDVLVYVDEMQTDANRNALPGTGVIKLKLPADGSWNFESMIRVPGVRASENGELLLEADQIDAFREAVGGFVMDDAVQQRLNRLKMISKAQAEAGRAGITPITDIVDPLNGNSVNTDKLLKGVRKRLASGREFKLGSHQAEMLKALADNGGRLIGAHFMGTGKTISAICAVKMMQNLTDENGNPHPNRPKRVAVVVPKNTAQQWISAVATFTDGKATLIGSGDLSGSLQMPSTPPGWERMPEAEKQAWWEEQVKSNGGLWNPNQDDTDIVVISQDYFTRHADELKRIGGFDGIIVDEAHGIKAGGEREEENQSKGNKRASKVEEWNPDMKMMMLLTGTPITNKLNSLTNYLKIISNGEIDLGTEKEFEDAFLTESAVQKASGSKKAAKMDLNPQMMGRLQKLLKPYMHVATTADVKGKTIPAVSLDENSPAEMTNMQAMIYRGYMDQLTPEEKALLDAAATLGEDENSLLKPEAKAKVLVARNITNTPGYKPKDGRQFITFEEMVEGKKKKTEFRLPGWARFQKEFGGGFPSLADVTSGKISHAEYVEIAKWVGVALARDYETIAGKKLAEVLTFEEMNAVKKGDALSSGLKFGQRVPNPEYGPEGMICRGQLDETGHVKPIEHVIRNEDGSVREVITVPAGLRFVRGKDAQYFMGGLPDDHPLAEQFESDWDFSKGDVDATKESAGQKPKAGRESMSVTRHPARRRERLMLDLAMTHGNAKCDALEQYIGDKLDPSKGNDPDAQMIIFGGVYPAVRTVEAKLRVLGYKDINEALNESLQSPDDPIPSNGKYFVTYMGSNETLGDRDINSEIFRKRKGPDGRDLKMSMFVHRSIHGSDGEPPRVGQALEGWNRGQRESIQKNFNIEVPSRVTAVEVNGTIEYRYAYESEMSPAVRKEFRSLEAQIEKASGAEKESLQKEMNKLLSKVWTDRQPLTKRQMDVFNNCQFMVASDAAQVGLNWGNAGDLVMYDSLFSPMDEWQRITRAARMLDPAIADKVKPTFDKLSALVESAGKEDGFASYEGNAAGALAIVQDLLDQHQTLRTELLATGMNPAAIAEAFLAQRSIDRINSLRATVGARLKEEGRVLKNAPKVRDPQTGEMVYQTIAPVEITSTDVMNEIIDNHLQPFEKQILRSRKYLVDVKRLTTSVETPEMETVTIDGQQVTRPTGKVSIEHPSKVERAQLMAGRAKQVPTEKLLSLVQEELPSEPSFDFVPASAASLSELATPERQEKTAAQKAAEAERKADYKQIRAEERARAKKVAEDRRAAEKAAKEAAKQASKAAKEAAKNAKASEKQQQQDSQETPQGDLAQKSMSRFVFNLGRK